MTKLEQVARAILEAKRGETIPDDWWTERLRHHRLLMAVTRNGYADSLGMMPESFREARAAIEAMRGPTTAMVCAIEAIVENQHMAAPLLQRLDGEGIWQAGIEAALAEADGASA